MRFGHFDDDLREYVITQPDTPLPWMNYLGCEDYFGLISNTAGGYSFYRDARLRRITRYRYNEVPFDFGGRYVYVRDDANGDFWSPSWQPTRSDISDYTCRHGLGYTVIGSARAGIRTDTTYFVPTGETLEVWDVRVTNNRSDQATLSIFSSIEFCLWDANDDATNFQRNFNTGEVEIEDGIIYHKTEYRERRNHFAYFACAEPIAGFETQREQFVGPYRNWDRPVAVERGTLSNSRAHGWSPIGSHHVRLALDPGQVKHVVFVLGYHENPPEDKFDPPESQVLNKRSVKPIVAKYRDIANVELSLQRLHDYWQGLLGVLQVETPDVHTNRMVNTWNPYQCMATFNISRSASFFESGIGRGLGFRDSNQDLLGFVHMAPARARGRILDLAATQRADGGAFHQYQPLTKRGNDAIGGNFNDDPLWLVVAASAYVKETGDWTVLDEPVAYENRPGSEQPLYKHLERSIRYTLDRLGPHGLPLIGRADWNDCLNLNCFSETPGESFQTTATTDGNVAESIFIAALFVLAGREMAGLAEHFRSHEECMRYLGLAGEMDRTVLDHGWDGAWFLRAYDAFGEKVGSRACDEGQIFIEPQGFCPLAGIGVQNGLARTALESVEAHLATTHGIALVAPTYSHYYPHLGEISSYPRVTRRTVGSSATTTPG